MTDHRGSSRPPNVSIVTPAWRGDRASLAGLLRDPVRGSAELIVCTPSDEEGAYHDLAGAHPSVTWTTAPRGRATQMNAGAALARGEWILFLHADSRLPPDWHAVFSRAAADPGVVGGSFRFALASRDWRARLLERGVRARVRLFDLPYGDQGLFARRDVFEAIGGYADLPLMEDIDFVRRLRRAGALLHDTRPVTTSARRWERDGWLRRSARNLGLSTSYFLGASPRALARRYTGRPWGTVALLARAPWLAGKSRLARGLAPVAHAGLRDALFEDTLGAARQVPGAGLAVVCEPASACEALRARVGPEVDVLAQRGADLGARMHAAFVDLFRLGAGGVVLVGSDLPDLPPQHVASALAALRAKGDHVVLGASDDGGYYLIGLTEPHPELFADVPWSTGAVLAETLERARASGLGVTLVDPWHDVDDWDDLARVAGAPGVAAAHTRAWRRACGDPGLQQREAGSLPGNQYPSGSQ